MTARLYNPPRMKWPLNKAQATKIKGLIPKKEPENNTAIIMARPTRLYPARRTLCPRSFSMLEEIANTVFKAAHGTNGPSAN